MGKDKPLRDPSGRVVNGRHTLGSPFTGFLAGGFSPTPWLKPTNEKPRERGSGQCVAFA